MLFLCFITLANLSINASSKSHDEYDDDQLTSSTSSCTKSINSSDTESINSSDTDMSLNEDEIGFFIEKPTLTWKTKYFKNPIIVRAKSFYNESGKARLQVIETPDSVYFNYMPEVAYKDFIECDGPIGEIDLDEYKELVEKYAPDYYQKLQRQTILHAVRYKRTVIDDIEFKNL